MQTFDLRDFLARSTDKAFEETVLARILDGLPRLSGEGPWIAGGALRRTIAGQEPNSDFDFFFRDEEQLSQFAGALTERGLTRVRETDHHLHFNGALGDSSLPRDVQLIRFAFYRSAIDVIDSFDFTICQFAFDGQSLFCGDYSLWDLGRRRLAVHKISFPLSTMRRVLKYAKGGFTACPGALTAILTATSDQPALREQLHIQYVD